MKVFLIIVLAIFGLGLFFRLRRKMKERKQYKQFLDVFERQPIALPTLKFGTVYAWPTFTVTFQTKTDYEFAKQSGLCELFNNRIQEFYDDEFRADLAVNYKHI
jgi:hypothetical protein